MNEFSDGCQKHKLRFNLEGGRDSGASYGMSETGNRTGTNKTGTGSEKYRLDAGTRNTPSRNLRQEAPDTRIRKALS